MLCCGQVPIQNAAAVLTGKLQHLLCELKPNAFLTGAIHPSKHLLEMLLQQLVNKRHIYRALLQSLKAKNQEQAKLNDAESSCA